MPPPVSEPRVEWCLGVLGNGLQVAHREHLCWLCRMLLKLESSNIPTPTQASVMVPGAMKRGMSFLPS